MIIPLIQALYDPRAPIPQDLLFYEKALQDIEFFALSSQIYYLFDQQGRWGQVPRFFHERLKQKYDETLCLNLFIKNQTNQLLRKFEEMGISVIPLKGVHFAEKYFGHLGARGTTDIDLLLQKHDLERAIACVKLLGYT
ncbi:nucleotidyltransferase family protein, partial [Paenibacillus sp. TAF58]